MNIKVLNELMKLNGITSYFHLSKETSIPYTTLLDLIRGKGERLSNIKTIADFFGVKVSYLIEESRRIITINEKNNIIIEKETGYNSLLSNLLSN
mgnify:CR=1 FL=1